MTRVVIVGAGFGGLACARALAGRRVETLLLDRNNFHLFTPLLYQVATSLLNPSDIAYPVRTALRPARNCTFHLAEISEVRPDARCVVTASGEAIGYDWLVLATGADNYFFGLAAVEKRAWSINNLSNALLLRDQVVRSFERAAGEPARAGEHLTFVIVGGGPTGVEYAGALAELVPLMRHDFPELGQTSIRIVLVEARERILPAFAESLGRHAAARLEQLGVEVRLGEKLEAVDGDAVTLSSGIRIPTRSLIWAAGVKPTPPAVTPFPRTTSGRIAVGPDLRVDGQERIFAIGDVAAAPSYRGEGEMPMLSAPAVQAGRYVARAIVALEQRHPLAPFRYHDKGIMAVVGRHSAVAQLGSLRFSGLIGWLMWLIVHLYFLIGFRNRLAVLLRWGWNYIFYDRPIRFIIPGIWERGMSGR
jgi:NADH dehydrogenase